MLFSAFQDFVTLVDGRYGDLGEPQIEEQNSDYESGTVAIGDQTWRIRTARITPKKPGAFVAVWRRDEQGETRPFDSSENIGGLLIFVREGQRFGVFRFSTDLLERMGVTRSERHLGKRGFRVYPSWSFGLNSQAQKTQRDQAATFEILRDQVTPG